MKILVSLALFFTNVSSINLILPFEGDDEKVDVTQSDPIVFKVNSEDCLTYITGYESKTEEIIQKVTYKGVEIFNNNEPVRQGSGRSVHYLEAEGSHIIVISPSEGPEVMEAMLWLKENGVYNLMYVKSLLGKVESKCPKEFSTSLKTLLYTKLPKIGLSYYEIQPTIEDGNHNLDQSAISCDDQRLMVNKIIDALKEFSLAPEGEVVKEPIGFVDSESTPKNEVVVKGKT